MRKTMFQFDQDQIHTHKVVSNTSPNLTYSENDQQKNSILVVLKQINQDFHYKLTYVHSPLHSALQLDILYQRGLLQMYYKNQFIMQSSKQFFGKWIFSNSKYKEEFFPFLAGQLKKSEALSFFESASKIVAYSQVPNLKWDNYLMDKSLCLQVNFYKQFDSKDLQQVFGSVYLSSYVNKGYITLIGKQSFQFKLKKHHSTLSVKNFYLKDQSQKAIFKLTRTSKHRLQLSLDSPFTLFTGFALVCAICDFA